MAFAHSTGPIASRTGAFAVAGKNAEPDCSVCHTRNPSGIPAGINDPSGSLRILGVPANYTPGVIYDLRVHLEHAWNPLPPDPVRWGFELQSVAALTGDSVGTWLLGANAPPDTFRSILGSPSTVWKDRRYIEHTRNLITDVGSTHVGELGPIEWHLRWQAPTVDAGRIYFFCAGNSANGDLTALSSGDFIFTAVDSAIAGPPLAVGPPGPLVLRDALDPPTPNPMAKCTDLTFTVAHAGMVDLAVFDLQGRKVKNVLHEWKAPGSYGSLWGGQRDDGSKAPNGVYFVRFQAPGQARAITRKVTLAR